MHNFPPRYAPFFSLLFLAEGDTLCSVQLNISATGPENGLEDFSPTVQLDFADRISDDVDFDFTEFAFLFTATGTLSANTSSADFQGIPQVGTNQRPFIIIIFFSAKFSSF